MAIKQHYMFREIVEQPEIIASTLSEERSNVKDIADVLGKKDIARIYIVGCGDMFFAATAARHAFMELAKIYAEPVESMELSRYLFSSIDEKCVVIALSVSGRTPRTIEASKIAKRRGAYIIAITDNPGSPLTKTSDGVIYTHTAPARELMKTKSKVPYVGYHHLVPQTKTYTTSLALLLSLATHLARCSNTSATMANLDRAVNSIKETIELHDEKIRTLAEEYSNKNRYIFVGAGPNTGTALYGSAKLMEFGILGVAQQMEEYCHVQFFATEPGDPVFIISPPGSASNRALEILPEMRRAKCQTIALAKKDDEDLRNVPDQFIGMPDDVDEIFTPLYYCVPLQLFAYHLTVKKGLNPNKFRGGKNLNAYQKATYQMIRKSRLRICIQEDALHHRFTFKTLWHRIL